MNTFGTKWNCLKAPVLHLNRASFLQIGLEVAQSVGKASDSLGPKLGSALATNFERFIEN